MTGRTALLMGVSLVMAGCLHRSDEIPYNPKGLRAVTFTENVDTVQADGFECFFSNQTPALVIEFEVDVTDEFDGVSVSLFDAQGEVSSPTAVRRSPGRPVVRSHPPPTRSQLEALASAYPRPSAAEAVIVQAGLDVRHAPRGGSLWELWRWALVAAGRADLIMAIVGVALSDPNTAAWHPRIQLAFDLMRQAD